MPASFKELAIFKDLPPDAVSEVENCGILRNFEEGQILFIRGGEKGKTFFVISGEINIYRTENGKRITLYDLREGDFFGDLSFTQHPGTESLILENSARAETASSVCVIATETFWKILKKFPELAMVVLVALRDKLHHAESRIKDLALSAAETRVINELIRYALRRGTFKDGFYEINDKLTHQDISEMVGVSRETVTKNLIELERLGFIEYAPGRFIRLNREKIIRDCINCLKMAQ